MSAFLDLNLFIFLWCWRRDYETKPPKLQLLSQIRSHLHRSDPHWTPEPDAPLDYCYVRPNHIPTINSMCQEFFWPGMFLLPHQADWFFSLYHLGVFLNSVCHVTLSSLFLILFSLSLLTQKYQSINASCFPKIKKPAIKVINSVFVCFSVLFVSASRIKDPSCFASAYVQIPGNVSPRYTDSQLGMWTLLFFCLIVLQVLLFTYFLESQDTQKVFLRSQMPPDFRSQSKPR